RGLGTLSVFNADGREVSLRIGVERVFDSEFEEGATRLNAIFQVGAVLPLYSGLPGSTRR
ncbi:MAG: hypothetical protein WBW88_15180, partial [Rhodothermales bacterium]